MVPVDPGRGLRIGPCATVSGCASGAGYKPDAGALWAKRVAGPTTDRGSGLATGPTGWGRRRARRGRWPRSSWRHVVLTACGRPAATPQTTAEMFVAAWNQNDWSAMGQYVDRPPPNLATIGPSITASLRASSVTHQLGIVTRRDPQRRPR